VEDDAIVAARLGEWLRRVALGATAALLTARVFWPSEPDFREEAGGGMYWVLALLVAAGVAIAGALVGGDLRLRWSWADLGVIALGLLAGMSAGHALDRRPALNLAWEWGGLAIAYLLVRNLPRTRGESSALAGTLVAAAVAVSVYGLYQAGVEIPDLQRRFLANRSETFRLMGVVPGTPSALHLENRLLNSNEPYATFALPNSLAGFLVGPLVVMLAVAWSDLTGRDGKRASLGALAIATFPTFAVLVCLLLTKSRSAYVGLAVGLVVLAWLDRRRVRTRTLVLGALAALLVAWALVTAGLAMGRLDPFVLTESGKSFRYRREYWIGSWHAIRASPGAFWGGFGPGNFAAPYLRLKLPEASEEVKDPHNLVLEVWAMAGLPAVLALSGALGFGLWNAFRPGRAKEWPPDEPRRGPPSWELARAEASAPPESPRWLVLSAALGWVVVLVVGDVNLFIPGQFERWMILGVSWALAIACGAPLWARRPPEPVALGAGALAVAVNLTAAGGIGIPGVALVFWTMLALAQNLRDDRGCGLLRDAGGRVTAFALAAVWVALLGSFVGITLPYWRCQAALDQAADALRARPPDYDRAEAAYQRAAEADRFSPRPWEHLAALDYQLWDSRGAKPDDLRWRKIPIELFKSVESPRPRDSWARHVERAQMMALILQRVGSTLMPIDLTRFRANVVESARTAALLYPTNATVRARLAEASAEIGMTDDAVKEARAALDLDKRTPHDDKKLDPKVRLWLEGKIPEWEKALAEAQDAPPPGRKPK
jgi:O-antigen ligase